MVEEFLLSNECSVVKIRYDLASIKRRNNFIRTKLRQDNETAEIYGFTTTTLQALRWTDRDIFAISFT